MDKTKEEIRQELRDALKRREQENGWVKGWVPPDPFACVVKAVVIALALIVGLGSYPAKADVEYPITWPITCQLFVTVPPLSEAGVAMHWTERWPATDIHSGMQYGHKKAADIWGAFPGAEFGLFCLNPEDEDRKAFQQAPEGGGHPGLSWRDLQ